MATITPLDEMKLAGALNEAPLPPLRRRRWLARLGWLAAIALAAGAFYYTNPLAKWFGPATTAARIPTVHPNRGNLLVTVTEEGNIESASNVDIKCEVAGGSTILWIIPDGTRVQAGDELVRLDSSTIEDSISQQKILWEKAKAAVVESEKTFSAAKIAVQEYLEGTFVKELQLADANIVIAMENLRSAENQLQHTERMARKGYVTSLQRDAQAFAVERAKLELEAQKTARDVLVRFTKPKMVEELESARDTAEALMRSNQAAYELENGRLDRLNLQLEKCTVTAPQDGMVVYANETSGRGRFGSQQGPEVAEGATVRERQSMIRLPDLTRMQVKVNVHESKVQSLRVGMRAHIKWQDRDLQGQLINIANQAEPFNFFAPNSKEYATIVAIDGEVPSELKPGMSAIVEILVANLTDVLTVPLNAIMQTPQGIYCWVETKDGTERRDVTLGMASNTAVEIKSGLDEKDIVVLNPRAFVAEAAEAARQLEAIDVNSRFGSEGPAPGAMQAEGVNPPARRGPPGNQGAENRRGASGNDRPDRPPTDRATTESAAGQ
jgi:multidrug resistance efflux pump